jgi:hypothetical protein
MGSIRLSLAVAAAFAAATFSSHAQSATATISAVAAGSSYDYTITLQNTGTLPLNSFWYAWTTSGDNLPSDPTSAANSLGWSNDLSANSIMWINSTGTALAPGASATFTFVSSSSPSAITKSPSGESVAYVGGIDFSQGVAGDSTGVFSPTLVSSALAVPTVTATISGVAAGSSFDYTITLQNTGTNALNSFWYGWTTSGDNLASDPTTAANSLGWGNEVSGNSIKWVNSTGTALAAGASATFTFVSSSSPSAITASPSGKSVAYVGAIDFTEDKAGDSSAVFSPTLETESEPPVILVQPQSQSVFTNVTVTFSVTASNATSYQWQSNTIAIAGQTDDTLTLSHVVIADSATYRVVVSNATSSVISSNAVLIVTAPTNTTAQIAGVYTGLFWDTNNLSNASSGWFSATVTSKDVLDGQVKIAGVTTSFTTKLQPSGNAAVVVSRHNQDALVLSLQVDLSGSGVLTGMVADANNTFNSQLTAYRAGFSASSPATEFDGYYTWAMPAASGIAPAGNSYGSATVAAAGGVRLSVDLGDGTTTTASGSLSTSGLMPLYLSLYNGQGSLLAWLSFDKSAGSLSTNSAYWFKDPLALSKVDASGNPVPLVVKTGPFPDGFTLTNLSLFVAAYAAPEKGVNALDSSNVAIQLSGADLSNSITSTFALNASGIGGSSAGPSVNISSKTGLFTGSFKDPSSGAPTRYAGAVLQPWQLGYGTLIVGGLSGAVVIAPDSALLPAVPPANLQVGPKFNQAGNVLIADQWNNRVIETTPSGEIVWSFGLGPLDFSSNSPISVNDVERVGDYTLMANPGDAPGVIPQTPNGSADNRVLLVDPAGKIVWQYGQFAQTGDGPNLLNTPVQCTFVPDFNVLITDQGNNRIIEVNYDKEIVWQYPGSDTNAADQLNAPNSAELLANGHILIADQGNNRALEVTSADEIVKTFSAGGTVNTLAFASRLPNGDTLLTDAGNARIVEVNAEDHVVWQYFTTNNAPNSPAGSASVASPQPTRAIRLPNGDTLISDQLNNRVILVNHAGKILADYGLPLPLDGGTFSGGSVGILIGANVGYGLFTTQAGLYSPYDAKIIGDYTGLTPPLATSPPSAPNY